jgi:hypothetical protein
MNTFKVVTWAGRRIHHVPRKDTSTGELLTSVHLAQFIRWAQGLKVCYLAAIAIDIGETDCFDVGNKEGGTFEEIGLGFPLESQ